jgi:FkbM family methyltransferase
LEPPTDQIKNPLRIGWSALLRLRAGIGAFWRGALGAEHARLSYSQYGEDMLLRAVFARYPLSYRGFYVDVGAHHPARFSNTRHFYDRQWIGICIDPLPHAARLFNSQRSRDIFLQVGVAETEGETTYYMFDEPALNTFSETISNAIVAKDSGRLTATQKVKTLPLRRILATHLPLGRVIDFLSVDVEGFDLQVLRSNDWARYRPRVVIIEETAVRTLSETAQSETARFMKGEDYAAVARTPSALLFADTLSPAYGSNVFLRYETELQTTGTTG